MQRRAQVPICRHPLNMSVIGKYFFALVKGQQPQKGKSERWRMGRRWTSEGVPAG